MWATNRLDLTVEIEELGEGFQPNSGPQRSLCRGSMRPCRGNGILTKEGTRPLGLLFKS